MKTRSQAVVDMLNTIARELANVKPDMPEEELRDAAISTLIGMLMKKGLEIQEAFDMVMGEGSYEEMAGNVYDTIRARAAAKG